MKVLRYNHILKKYLGFAAKRLLTIRKRSQVLCLAAVQIALRKKNIPCLITTRSVYEMARRHGRCSPVQQACKTQAWISMLVLSCVAVLCISSFLFFLSRILRSILDSARRVRYAVRGSFGGLLWLALLRRYHGLSPTG